MSYSSTILGQSVPAAPAAALPERLAKAHYVEVEGGANHTIPPAATADSTDRFLAL